MNKRPTKEELRARITEALIRDIGVSERMAQPFVESILGCFAGQQPYFPAQEKTYPVMHIRAALEHGDAPKVVRHRFGISRTTLHKLFPGGLPQKVETKIHETG